MRFAQQIDRGVSIAPDKQMKLRHLALVVILLAGCGREPARAEAVRLSDQERWTRKVKCYELSSARDRLRTAEAAASERTDPTNSYIVLRAEYCFSETLNTCLYEEELMPHPLKSDAAKRPNVSRHASVIDLLTGAFLADAWLPVVTPSSDTQQRTLEEYNRRREALFKGCAK